MFPLLRPHRLDLDELVRIQHRVAELVRQEDGFQRLERIAGCDISFSRGDRACAACVVLDYRSLEPQEERVRSVKVRFPYIPTFLAFRELEGMLRVLRGTEADVYMVGAQGVAHPRRAGLASHLGVVLDRPTLGVAKSRLVGEADAPGESPGSYTWLRHEGEIVGAVLRTRRGAKPVYVSVGHRLTLETAVRITLETTRGHRLPEPLRRAHELATRAMRERP
jgi:deoxyribonuclease V